MADLEDKEVLEVPIVPTSFGQKFSKKNVFNLVKLCSLQFDEKFQNSNFALRIWDFHGKFSI